MINIYRNDQWFLHSDMLIQIHVRPKKGYEKGCARQCNTIQGNSLQTSGMENSLTTGGMTGLANTYETGLVGVYIPTFHLFNLFWGAICWDDGAARYFD